MASSGCSVEKSKTLQGLLSPFGVPSTWTPFLCPRLPPPTPLLEAGPLPSQAQTPSQLRGQAGEAAV